MANYSEYGDTPGTLGGYRHGRNQTLPSKSPQEFPDTVNLFGDADIITGFASGGDDRLHSFGRLNILSGDARLMELFARGGDDTITVSGPQNKLYGDAFTMQGLSRGGNDHMTAGSAGFARGHSVNELFGDAGSMSGFARGGDDILSGPPAAYSSLSYLYGDAHTMSGFARAGNDTLISGRNQTEHMWGDAAVKEGPFVRTGQDIFVFAPLNATDFIHDFEQGKDRIDLTAYAASGIHGFADLEPLISVKDTGSVITFGSHVLGRFPGETVVDSVDVIGVRSLAESDFIFG